MTRTACLVVALLGFSGAILNAQTECVKDFPSQPGRGTTTDGRRILTLHISSDWDSSPGYTMEKVWNGVNNAIWELNNNLDGGGDNSPYFIQIDQLLYFSDLKTSIAVQANSSARGATGRSLRAYAMDFAQIIKAAQ